MKTIRTALVALSLAGLVSVLAAESPTSPKQADTKRSIPNSEPANESTAPTNPQIDYRGFMELTIENEPIRKAHRVKVKQFVSMSIEPGTIILDTRSKSAFDEVHVRGAVHLNFSDFTDEKLAKVIPNKTTRVLIYCNNNFLPNRLQSLMLKGPPLALNIPTFINLRGYGYKNVFELADVVALDDSRLKLAGTAIKNQAEVVIKRK